MSIMQLATIAIFWVAGATVVYGYAAYPIFICLFSKLFGSRTDAPMVGESDLPQISLLVAAHNEEAVIERRILNALSIDYPRDRIEVVIASDGSTDETAAVVRRIAAGNVRLLDYTPRRGKASVLNDAVKELRSPIILLSDANTLTNPDAARRLVRWFSDSTVGAVCGKLVITDPASGGNVDSSYWKYETFLKTKESRLGALLGSNGAIYAIRRELFPNIPSSTIVDDLVIPLLAKQRTGCRIIYDGSAIAHEESAPDVAMEFRRRARIGAGGWQAIGILWRLLNPARGWIALTFFSHKIVRWSCPFLLILVFACNLLLAELPVYRLMLWAQLAFYTSAIVGALVPPSWRFCKPLRVVYMFVSMNAALLVGFFRWVLGTQSGTWTRTVRSEEAVMPGA